MTAVSERHQMMPLNSPLETFEMFSFGLTNIQQHKPGKTIPCLKKARAGEKNKSKPNFPLAFILDVIKRLKRIFQAWLQPDGTAGKFFSIRSLIQSCLVKSLRSHLLKSSIILDLFWKTQSFCFKRAQLLFQPLCGAWNGDEELVKPLTPASPKTLQSAPVPHVRAW